MSEQYPFPLPEAIQNKADEVISRLGNHPGAYLMYPPNANPQCLNAFDSSLLELSIIHEAIDLAASDLSDKVSDKVGCEAGRETSLLYTAVNALEAELDRMKQVLKWGYLTWKYDPAIRKAFNGESLPPIPEPETSPEATPAAN